MAQYNWIALNKKNKKIKIFNQKLILQKNMDSLKNLTQM